MFDYNPGLDIFIASRDRPVETLRAINALKLVDFGVQTRIIVSDNASSEATVLRDLPADVLHLVRESCDAQTHFNLIVSELNCDWFLFTHDDDEILPALGQTFQRAMKDHNVNIVSGRSKIIGSDGKEVIDPNYENRLRDANLLGDGSNPILDFNQLLFDFGTLLPASAIIMKTSLVKNGFELNPDTNYAGDFEYSLAITRDAVVKYCGNKPVMNYHLHGSNSVFNSELPYVLPSQTLICRISEILLTPSFLNSERLERLRGDLKRATLLAFEAGEVGQLERLMKYVLDFEETFKTSLSSRFTRLLYIVRSVGFPLQYALRLRRRILVKHVNSGI